MKSVENPRSSAELCSWLESNLDQVCDVIRQLPPAQFAEVRDRWKALGHELESAADQDFNRVFGDFAAGLVHSDRSSVLPPGFANYLLLVRQLTEEMAVATRRRFRAVIQTLNETISDTDQDGSISGQAGGEGPRKPEAADDAGGTTGAPPGAGGSS